MGADSDTEITDSDDSLEPATEDLGFKLIPPDNSNIDALGSQSLKSGELTRTTDPLGRRELTMTLGAAPADSDRVENETDPEDDGAGAARSAGAGTLDTARAEAICRQFEDDLQKGKGPRIDECIRDIVLPQRDALLSMLIAAELRFRVRAGERPTVEEYLNRFPENRAVVDAVFLSTIGPERIGPFRVIRFLGGGNFGRVYLCRDEQLNRLVAIKVPRPDRFTGPEGVDRFLREARHAARVKHSGIVAVHRADSDGVFGCYVVMEYVEGGSLAALLKKKQLTRIRAVEMLVAVANAMSFAHEMSLVHRDLKPENILLDNQGQPHIADFGLAVHEDERWPLRGEIAGTPVYMAPEQVRGESHRLDGRTDLWALGIILYRILTGHRPFDGRCTEEIFEDILDREPVPPRQRDRTISRELERICLKCLAKRMTDRYATASDFADDLRNWLASSAADSHAEHAPTPTVPSNDGKNPIPPDWRSPGSEIPPPVRVRPKGLRAFDGNDRDFFLELLPGPRDRDGLPESLRFWKVRIEPGKHEVPFSVGLLSGPSGSGKTSMVKAGLLCRLAEDEVIPVYIEAMQGATEAQLKAQLCRVATGGTNDLSLPEIVAGLRSGALQTSGRKVLIVLDQFEQWLHARPASPECDDELIRSLRQCDGAHVQCLVLVRDDFAMAAARFMRALEVRLVESENFATIDPFDLVHARKVLRAFGVAYDRLKADDEPGLHERFLDQATAELAEDGKIAPVRLALFAQMIKGKPWTPTTLRDVGGLQGIGVTFLDESLDGPAANPEHRLHLPAARRVLKALLPQGAADIKGHLRSEHELLVASGYERRQGDFDRLIAILGTELRLITPTDPRGDQFDDAVQPGTSAGAYYHLTHDYLVPSLRAWINKNETKTISGRTAIRLSERTAEWTSRPSRRYLPSWWEWLMFMVFTRRARRSQTERRMLVTASLYHSTRLAIVAAGATLIFMAASEWLGALNAHTAVRGLESAEASSLPRLLENLRPYRRWADPLLRDMIADGAIDPRRKARARLALLPVDAAQGDGLLGPIVDQDHDDFLEIRNALSKYGDRTQLAERCRVILQNERASPDRRLRAGMVLAGLLGSGSASDDSVLNGAAVFLAGHLIDSLLAHPDRYNDWMAAMNPARSPLISPLERMFRDANRPEGARVMAATVIANFAREDPNTLRELLLDSNIRQFPVILYALSGFRAQANGDLSRLIKESPLAGWSSTQKSALASRQANAAIGLLNWGDSGRLWPLLRHSPDPILRTYLIDRLARLAPDPLVFLSRLDEETDVSVRRALVLILGGVPAEQESPIWAAPTVARLLSLYENDPDAGIHSAAEWALTQWNLHDRLKEVNSRLVNRKNPDEFSWTMTPRGQTMATLRPATFRMGAGDDDGDQESDERPVTRVIPRTFSIATKEVTAKELLELCREFDRYPNDACRRPDCSINIVRWEVAIAFCRRLSEREHIVEKEMCYPAVREIKNGAKPFSDYLSRTGYRLPTEAELEYAGRAGAITSRYFGDDDKMLPRYAWFIKNSDGQTHPGGMRLPNEFGLFDVLGNVREWCHDSYSLILPSGVDREDRAPFDTSGERVARGGSFVDGAHVLRSANRYYTKAGNLSLSVGLRVARTVSTP